MLGLVVGMVKRTWKELAVMRAERVVGGRFVAFLADCRILRDWDP